MDKIKVNNQVVLMRKFVKQAKTRIINKYVKEVRLLENRKGDDNQVLKCKRKAERLLLEIEILKKIKPDAVSKMALSKGKYWQAILNQKTISLEERCFAMLANYEPVQKEVEKFHLANSYLVPIIASLVEEWEEKAKLSSGHPKKNGKGSKIVQLSAEKTKSDSNEKLLSPNKEKKATLSQNSGTSLDSVSKQLQYKETQFNDVSHNESDSTSKSSVEFEEESGSEIDENLKIENSEKQFCKSEKESKIMPNIDQNSAHSDSETEDKLENACHKNPAKNAKLYEITKKPKKSSQESVKSNINSRNISTTNKEFEPFVNNKKETHPKKPLTAHSNSTKAVALLNLNEMLDLDEIPIKNISSDTETTLQVGKRKRDAFFLDDNGQVESGSDDNENAEDSGQENSELSSRNKLFKNFNRKDLNANCVKGKWNSKYKKDVPNENNFKNQRNHKEFSHTQKFDFRGGKRTNKNFYSKDQVDSNDDNQDRYQWNSNKNKRMNSIDKKDKMDARNFKTKERTFEKNFSSSSSKKNRTQGTKMDNFNKKAKVDEQAPLHPSWEAKRKLKECTKAKFQGKRIVFDE